MPPAPLWRDGSVDGMSRDQIREGEAVRAGGGECDAVVLVVSTARMARRRNLAVLSGD